MKTIDEIILQDNRWRKLAEGICGDYDQAQDLVQEMYINIMNKKDISQGYISDGYIYMALRNIWIGQIKKKKTVHEYCQFESFLGIDVIWVKQTLALVSNISHFAK